MAASRSTPFAASSCRKEKVRAKRSSPLTLSGAHVQHPCAEHRAGIERELQPLVGLVQFGLGALPPAFGEHARGGFDDHRQHAGRRAAVVGDRAVVEIHPHVFGFAVAQQHQFLVAIRQRAARETRGHDMPVEVGDFRPAVFDRAAEQIGMPSAREDRVGVVVDHVAGLAPQQHQRHRRGEQQLDGGSQTARPVFDGAEAGGGPVECADALRHLPAPAGAAVVLGRKWHAALHRGHVDESVPTLPARVTRLHSQQEAG